MLTAATYRLVYLRSADTARRFGLPYTAVVQDVATGAELHRTEPCRNLREAQADALAWCRANTQGEG